MAKRKKLFHLDMSFDEALRRYVQTDPKELADMIEEAKRKGEEVERFIEERVDSIQRAARRAPKRFRL
jgi:predicted CopG family antitoxin